MTGTLGFAFAAGMLSTVNPCGFAMLPAFLAYTLGTEDSATDPDLRNGPQLRRAIHGLSAGLLLSAGFASVVTLTALLVTAGLRTVIGAVPWAAVLIGAVLTVLGVALLAGRHVGVTLNSRGLTAAGRGSGAMLAFGAAYAIASLSCTLGVLLAVVAQALATSSIGATAAAFGAYAAGGAAVLVPLALSATLASGALAAGLHRASRYLPGVAGVMLLASGIYLVAYWAPALRTGHANATLARPASRVSGSVARLLSAHTGTVALAAMTAALTVALAALWAHHHHHRRGGPDPSADAGAFGGDATDGAYCAEPVVSAGTEQRRNTNTKR